MARVKLSEYRAKSLMLENYPGVRLSENTLTEDIKQLDDATSYVIKVDQGVKKRGKQGLIRLNVDKSKAESAAHELFERGYNRCLAEPMFDHNDDEEQYVSFERNREGIVIMHSESGGVDVESENNIIRTYSPNEAPLPQSWVSHITEVMDREHMSFVEINPLIVRDDTCHLLDAAVLVDSAGEFEASWGDEDLVEQHKATESEAAVATLNENSPAAFTFRLLNPNGAIWLLLSGGGASITIADEAMNQGKADLIGNYGEYSGGPTSEETYLYTKAVLQQALASNAPQKALVIAGGVANFTDVKKTFTGLIQALKEVVNQLREQNVKVFVRRGGPNEKEGLAMMRQFLEKNDLYGSVHGSDIVLTNVVNEALEYINA